MSRKKSRDSGERPQQRRTTRPLRAVPPEQSDGPTDPAGLADSTGPTDVIGPVDDSPHGQELFQTLRRALRSDEPLDFLGVVGGLLLITDPRRSDPFDPEDRPRVTIEELVESFMGVDYSETTAALHVLRALTADELLAARIGKVLAGRRQPMPRWIKELGQPSITRVVEMKHVLGDGDDYFLETELAGGESLTALVYVDRNVGTVVKDAFLIPQGVDAVRQLFLDEIGDPDTTFAAADPAEVRAILTDAIERGALTFPPLESDTWPMCRPVVEWLVRSLPEGGSLPAQHEWSDDELAALRDDFLASPYGEPGDRDWHDLVQSITWFGSGGWAGTDPLRWSPVNVEVFLADWMPSKVIAETEFLLKTPAVLRAFVGYCHDRQGIRPELTQETLAAVDQWEPVFRDRVESSQPHGSSARVADLLGDAWDGTVTDGDLAAISEIMLGYLDGKVGGRASLMALDDLPLPDEPFDWTGIPDDIHPRVHEVLDWCDRCAGEFLDVEHRTAFRRFLARSAVGDPVIFRRQGAANRAAAAVCWAVGRANDTVGPGGRISIQEMLGWFGVKGSITQRAEVFLAAVGADRSQWREVTLGSGDYLVGERRAELIRVRDRYLADRD